MPLWNRSEKINFEWDIANICDLFIEKKSLTFSEPKRLPIFLFSNFIFTLLMAIIQVAKIFVGSTAPEAVLVYTILWSYHQMDIGLVDETVQTSYLPVSVM